MGLFGSLCASACAMACGLCLLSISNSFARSLAVRSQKSSACKSGSREWQLGHLRIKKVWLWGFPAASKRGRKGASLLGKRHSPVAVPLPSRCFAYCATANPGISGCRSRLRVEPLRRLQTRCRKDARQFLSGLELEEIEPQGLRY